jgi:hypothetical protein
MQIKEFDKILEKHIRLTLLPQLRNTLNIFAIGGALGAHLLSAENMRSQLEAVGILHGDEIDTEKMRDFLVGGFEATPEVPLFGIRFNRNDAESLLRAFGLSWPEARAKAAPSED